MSDEEPALFSFFYRWLAQRFLVGDRPFSCDSYLDTFDLYVRDETTSYTRTRRGDGAVAYEQAALPAKLFVDLQTLQAAAVDM